MYETILLTTVTDSELSVAPDDTILHCEAANPSNSITKSRLRELSQQIAHGLREEYSVGANAPGKDVVTVISYGQILVPAALYGVIAAGGVYSAASPSSTLDELVRQITVGKSHLVICGSEHRDLAVKAAEKCGLPARNVLLLDSTKDAWSLKTVSNNTNIITGACLQWPKITDAQELKKSLIVILWSSGTTGLPKGVCLSHQNLVAETFLTGLSAREWAAAEMEKGTFVPKQHQTLAHLPISHIAGLFGYMVAPICSGATVIWMRKYAWDDLMKYLKQYTITTWYTVPSIWLRISKSPEIQDRLKHLEGAVTGAAPMDGDLMQAVNRKVGDGKEKMIGQTWGLSETTGAVTAMPKGEVGDESGCIGYILPGVELRMVDEQFRDVDPEKEEGELLVRSPLVTQGYFDNPKATEEAFHGEWFCSGDIAVRRNGKFYIVDRKKVGCEEMSLAVMALTDSPCRRSYSNTKASKSPPPSSKTCSSSTHAFAKELSSVCRRQTILVQIYHGLMLSSRAREMETSARKRSRSGLRIVWRRTSSSEVEWCLWMRYQRMQ